MPIEHTQEKASHEKIGLKVMFCENDNMSDVTLIQGGDGGVTTAYLTILNITSAVKLLSGAIAAVEDQTGLDKVKITIDGVATEYLNVGDNAPWAFILPPIKADSSLKIEIAAASDIGWVICWNFWTKS